MDASFAAPSIRTDTNSLLEPLMPVGVEGAMRIPIRVLCFVLLAVAGSAVYMGRVAEPLTLEIRDYVQLPITGKTDSRGNNEAMLARINGLHEEPGGANRFFVHDLNGPLYIVDKETKKL